MPFVQTAYGQKMRPGRAGLVVNMETQNSITRTYEGTEGLPFGVPVVQGVQAKGILLPGQVALSAAAAARAGNTGNGTITATPAVAGANVKEGVYTAIADGGAANGGSFRLEDPDGEFLGVIRVGVAATLGGLGPITITDGATDFVDGDGFNITVTSAEGGLAFRGYTIEDKTLIAKVGETVDQYQKGNNVGLMVAGVIWADVGPGAVVAGEPVYFNTVTKKHVAAAGAGVFEVPNAVYDSDAAANGIVEVRVSYL